jgi:hypothetical protein
VRDPLRPSIFSNLNLVRPQISGWLPVFVGYDRINLDQLCGDLHDIRVAGRLRLLRCWHNFLFLVFGI